MYRSFLLLCLLLSACAPAPAVVVQTIPSAAPADWVEVFFTDPYAPTARNVRGGPDELLARAIQNARSSVLMAIYDLNLWSIRDALLDAHARGLDVRLVVEANNQDRRELQQLIDAGVPVVLDTGRNFMHNKFVVIDGYEVWTGSTNFTVSDMYGNRNNLLRLRSTALAENYTSEFEEMFTHGLFGENTRDNTPHPELTIGEVEIHTYFSPDDGVMDALVDVIDSAEESIYFLAFSFTLDELGDALVRAQQRGVEVRGIVDDDQINNQGNEYPYLLQNGVQVYLDEPDSNLHDKVLIIDRMIVVTGSYNFSSNAEFRNDENTLILFDEQLAGIYFQHFQLLWALTQK
ncbi:MAG: hypothetical protein KIS88_10065 [Anaerolineales bacterium]|nr:hypothetical protein [Anaerolineales bacterium]